MPTPEFIITALLALSSGFLAPVVIQWLQKRKSPADAIVNIAQSAQEIAEGGERAVAAAARMFEIYETRMSMLNLRVIEQDKQIVTLQALVTSMQFDEQKKEAYFMGVINALKLYVKHLADILRENKLEVPPRPDILKESDPKIKAIKI
jgi:uncharacterized coiled-coil protein SlyX